MLFIQKQRGDGDHGGARRIYSLREIELWQQARAEDSGYEIVHQLDSCLSCGNDQQQGANDQSPTLVMTNDIQDEGDYGKQRDRFDAEMYSSSGNLKKRRRTMEPTEVRKPTRCSSSSRPVSSMR